MRWQRDGQYAIKSGVYVVSKAMTERGWVYTAVRLGSPSEILGHGADAEQCKALCEMDGRNRK